MLKVYQWSTILHFVFFNPVKLHLTALEITKSFTRSIIICRDNCKKGENKQRYLLLLILGDTLTVSGSCLVKLL